MAGQVRFFDAVDPFNLADWEVQNGPSPSRTKQRAQCLSKHGNELMHTQFGTQDSGTIVYKAKKATGFLTVPNVGLVSSGWHIDSWTVTYAQKGYVSLSLNVHKHIDGTVDANCRQYAPTFKVPAVLVGCPTSIPAATGTGTVFALTSNAVVGVRGIVLSMALNHVDEDAANGAHFASDNYDGSETIQVDFCGDVDPETDYTLNSDWTDDNFAKSQGNTVATTSSLTASHHVANVDGTGTTDYDDEDDEDDDDDDAS